MNNNNNKRVFNLQEHLTAVKEGKLRFENAFEGVSRMILDQDIEKVVVNGKTTYDFKIFRNGKKHIIGLYDEINSFVSFVKDAAEGGSSKEMAYVLVGEPGNGKTFFIEYVCSCYRQFLSIDENRKYTFRFKHLDQLGNYGKINVIESQTYEDPVIMAMNLMHNREENKELRDQIAKLTEDRMNLGEQFGAMLSIRERLEELEDYVDIGVLRKQVKDIEDEVK